MSLFNINCKHIINELIDNLFELNIALVCSGKWKTYSACRMVFEKAYWNFLQSEFSTALFPPRKLYEAFLKKCWREMKNLIISWNAKTSKKPDCNCRKLSVAYEIGKMFSCSWKLNSDRLISKRSGIFSFKKQRTVDGNSKNRSINYSLLTHGRAQESLTE